MKLLRDCYPPGCAASAQEITGAKSGRVGFDPSEEQEGKLKPSETGRTGAVFNMQSPVPLKSCHYATVVGTSTM